MANRKTSKTSKSTDELVFDMMGVATAENSVNDDALLASMLGDDILDEIMEDEADAEPETIEAAVADIEKAEARQAIYDEQDAEIEESVSGDADKPSTAAVKEPKAKREKKAKAPKEPRVTSVTHKPGERLMAILGGNKAFLTFGKSDDTLAAERRADDFLTAMDDREAIADKVKDKAIMLMGWLASGKDVSELNEVLRRSFEVLINEGELTGGQKGNLQTNLLSKPYSPGTAASQANQMFMLFPILGITKREKGRMVADPESTIVEAMKLKMGLSA